MTYVIKFCRQIGILDNNRATNCVQLHLNRIVGNKNSCLLCLLFNFIALAGCFLTVHK